MTSLESIMLYSPIASILLILLIICFIVSLILALDAKTYVSGCKDVIKFTDDHWKSSLEWGNILLKICIYLMKIPEMVILLIMFSAIYAFRRTFVFIFKSR